jgi:hypothetical protein
VTNSVSFPHQDSLFVLVFSKSVTENSTKGVYMFRMMHHRYFLQNWCESTLLFSSLNIVFDFSSACYFGANMFLCRIFEQIIFCAKEIPAKIFFTLTETVVRSVTVWFNYFRRSFVSHWLTAGCQLCRINKLFTGLTITHEDKAQCTRHPIKSVISRD